MKNNNLKNFVEVNGAIYIKIIEDRITELEEQLIKLKQEINEENFYNFLDLKRKYFNLNELYENKMMTLIINYANKNNLYTKEKHNKMFFNRININFEEEFGTKLNKEIYKKIKEV